MKRYNFILLSSLMILVMFSISCQKSFFTGVNNNPDAPAYVPETNLLPPIENSLAYNQGSLVSRMTSEWTQQIVGFARQQAAYYTYAVTVGDFDVMWSNYYQNVMENDVLLIQQADKNGNNEYAGIARLILAYTLQSMVDKWGDMPYSKAFQGVIDLQPTYDHATDIYTVIGSLITDGINNLSNADPGALVPSTDNGADNIYNGNESQWIEFGHAIQARLYIHQSATDPSMASKALTEVASSFQSNADNATYFFSTVETNSAPYYQFNAQRTGDLSYATSYLASLMISLHDPRYPVYIDSANDAGGFGLAAYYGSNNSPVEFITRDEMDFVEAEAALRASGDVPTAATAYANGITDNMTKLGISSDDIATYIAANPMPTDVQGALDAVAQQEYIALYLNPEEYTTYRRTGIPVLTPPPGSGNAVPRRFLYPGAEYAYNSVNTPQASLQSPLLFWDHQ